MGLRVLLMTKTRQYLREWPPCRVLRYERQNFLYKIEKPEDSYSYVAVFYWKQKPLPRSLLSNTWW